MSYKWNEKSTLVFLNAYQKHPCLWNPNHVEYYDCLAKNEALKNIIRELNVPEVHSSDCLKQIKVIREIYGQEQLRIIKALQSCKSYKPSYVWFPIISEMLAKVISDEGKLQSRRPMKTVLSPHALKECMTRYNKHKNALNFPCAQREIKEYGSENKTKPAAESSKSRKFTKNRYIPVVPVGLSDKEKCNTRLDLLQCPSCGWEDSKCDKLNEKIHKRIKSSDFVMVPCLKYMNFVDKSLKERKDEECKDREQILSNTYQEKDREQILNNTYLEKCTGPNFPQLNSPSYPTKISIDDPQRSYINQQTQVATIMQSKSQLYTEEIKLPHKQLFSEKQVGTNIKDCNEAIQNAISISRSNVDPSLCKCATLLQRLNQPVLVDTVQERREKMQNKSVAQEESKEVAVNTVQQCDKKIQNSISSEESTLMSQESKRIDTSAIKCFESDSRNVIGIRLKIAKCSKSNFVLITIDGNHASLMHVDCKKSIDKAEKDSGELKHDQKECYSRDTIEIIKYNSVVTQALLECLEKIIPFQEENSVNSNSSERTICESSKFADEDINFSVNSGSFIKSGSLCCLPDEIEKTDVIAMLTNTFLEVMKHALMLNSKRYIKNGECISKEDAIDRFIFLNKMKECAEKILKIHMIANYLKQQSLNEFYSRQQNRYPSRMNLVSNSIQTGVLENGMEQRRTNAKDIEVLYTSPASQITDHSFLENYVAERPKKSFAKKEKIVICVKDRDVGLNTSSSYVLCYDLGIQCSPSACKQLQDRGVVTEQDKIYKKKINVGTQTRKPILLRIIRKKMNNDEDVLKEDKATYARDVYLAETEPAEEYVEMYPIYSPFSRNMHRMYSTRQSYNRELYPNVSHTCKKEVAHVDYRTSSLLNENYDKQYTDSLPSNQSVEASEQYKYVSRIPLYTRLHKYMRKRSDTYEVSEPYA